MTSQNDRQDRSLTGQVRDQAGQCRLTGRYFQPWLSENNEATLYTVTCDEKPFDHVFQEKNVSFIEFLYTERNSPTIPGDLT